MDKRSIFVSFCRQEAYNIYVSWQKLPSPSETGLFLILKTVNLTKISSTIALPLGQKKMTIWYY
jgi:hypothetical protein